MLEVDNFSLHKLNEEFLSYNILYVTYGFLYMTTTYKCYENKIGFNKENIVYMNITSKTHVINNFHNILLHINNNM
jgi:hypothetical protein